MISIDFVSLNNISIVFGMILARTTCEGGCVETSNVQSFGARAQHRWPSAWMNRYEITLFFFSSSSSSASASSSSFFILLFEYDTISLNIQLISCLCHMSAIGHPLFIIVIIIVVVVVVVYHQHCIHLGESKCLRAMSNDTTTCSPF